MPKHHKKSPKKKVGHKPDSLAELEQILDKDGVTINITIQNTFNIGNHEINVEQRAEGGGQINKDVGTNANQGGQNAIDHSASSNNQSQFADGNGRSGIAGNDNDEAGGQQGIKVRDSSLSESKIISNSCQNQGQEEQM